MREDSISANEDFNLPRKQLKQAYVDLADTSDEAVKQEMLRACEDDPALTYYVLDSITA